MPTYTISGTLAVADGDTILLGAIAGSFTTVGVGPNFTVLNGGITVFQISVSVGSTVLDPVPNLVFDAVASGTIFTTYNSDTGLLTVPAILEQIVNGNAPDVSYPFSILMVLQNVVAEEVGTVSIQSVEAVPFATGTFSFVVQPSAPSPRPPQPVVPNPCAKKGRQIATSVGRRILQLKGGSAQPIYLKSTTSYDEDKSRGIRGTVVPSIVLLKPRPTLKPATGEMITRQSAVLQQGDFQLELPGDQVTICALEDSTARIVVGEEEFRIVKYEPKYVGGSLAYVVAFIRGSVS